MPIGLEGRGAGSNMGRWDDVVECAGYRFAVEYKIRSDAASIAGALEQVRRRRPALAKGTSPLLVVDLMGERGRQICEREGVDWIDLAGNASITHVPRMRILVEGKLPAHKSVGRKRNAFATKSSRVAHWLLLHQGRVASQREIAEGTGVDKGQLSRVLSRLEELQLVRRGGDGVSLLKPRVLLEAWRESYALPTRNVLRGVFPSRSGEESIKVISGLMKSMNAKHAFGGLAAAWLLDGFADFRITTCHVEGVIDPLALKEIGFVESARGANLWLIMHADAVALMGARRIRGTQVASPYFTYVDLAAHPERSREASEHLLEHAIKFESRHEG